MYQTSLHVSVLAVPIVILPRIHVGKETKWFYKTWDFKHNNFWIIIFEITYCAATCISAILGLMMITISFCWYYANPIENERKLAQRISFEPKFQATTQFIRARFIKYCPKIKYEGRKVLHSALAKLPMYNALGPSVFRVHITKSLLSSTK